MDPRRCGPVRLNPFLKRIKMKGFSLRSDPHSARFSRGPGPNFTSLREIDALSGFLPEKSEQTRFIYFRLLGGLAVMVLLRFESWKQTFYVNSWFGPLHIFRWWEMQYDHFHLTLFYSCFVITTRIWPCLFYFWFTIIYQLSIILQNLF